MSLPTVPSMPRVLYVVARDRPDVYNALRESFVESPRLGIVMDRRDTAPSVSDTPAAERRRLIVDEALRTRGWALVRIESAGTASLVEQASVPQPRAIGATAGDASTAETSATEPSPR